MTQQKTKFDDGTWKHELRKISELIPNPQNPRTITEATLKGLRESLNKNGYTHRIIIDKNNMILSGHARWIVMSEEDPEAEIEVLVAQRELTDEEMKAAVLGHNVLGGEWNIDALKLDFDDAMIQSFGIIVPDFEVVAPQMDVQQLDKGTDAFFKVQIIFESEMEVDDFCARYDTDGAKGRLSIKWENLKRYLVDFQQEESDAFCE